MILIVSSTTKYSNGGFSGQVSVAEGSSKHTEPNWHWRWPGPQAGGKQYAHLHVFLITTPLFPILMSTIQHTNIWWQGANDFIWILKRDYCYRYHFEIYSIFVPPCTYATLSCPILSAMSVFPVFLCLSCFFSFSACIVPPLRQCVKLQSR